MKYRNKSVPRETFNSMLEILEQIVDFIEAQRPSDKAAILVKLLKERINDLKD